VKGGIVVACTSIRAEWLADVVRHAQISIGRCSAPGTHGGTPAQDFVDGIVPPIFPLEHLIVRCLAIEIQFASPTLRPFVAISKQSGVTIDGVLSQAHLPPDEQLLLVGARAFELLRRHYADRITVISLAHTLGVSATAVKRAVSAITGVPIHRCLCRIRVDEAARRLRMSDVKIEAIALDVGFRSRRSLNRNFIATHGISPNEYRQRWLACSGGAFDPNAH
jgi:AraC-like DNA-binding protein